MQRAVVGQALDLLEQATMPRTTVQSPAVWSDDQTWRRTFLAVTDENREVLRSAGDARRNERAGLKAANQIR